jgi:hypothetical protein
MYRDRMLTCSCASSLPRREGYLPVSFHPLVVSLALGRRRLCLSRHPRHLFPLSYQGLGQGRNLQYQVLVLGDTLLQVSRDDLQNSPLYWVT